MCFSMKMEASLTVLLFAIQFVFSRACDQNATRLVNGENKFEGRVEVCKGGEWKSICDSDGWDNKEATVVCTQIGFSGNLSPVAKMDPQFSQGAGSMIEVRWECLGNERHLFDCPTRNSTSCNVGEAAGVVCFGMTDNCTEPGEIRISNDYSGRVEVCLDGLWGTVCDDGWDINDATTVCTQLGYHDIKRGIPTRRAYFGEGSGPIHLSRAQCKSNNIRLIDCDIDKTGVNNCQHNEDAGVICFGNSSCKDGDVRLVGGESEREGRVEICYSRVWGTVCDYGWDEVDANVVCSQLGYGQRGLATKMSHFGSGEGPVLLNNVECNQSHTNLSQCVHESSIGLRHCSSGNTAGVICPEITTTFRDTTTTTKYTTGSSSDTIGTTLSSTTLGTTESSRTPSTTKSGTIKNADVGHTVSPSPNMETRAETTTTVKLLPIIQSAVIGAVSGALIVGIFAAFVIVLLMVMLVRRRKKYSSEDGVKKGPVKNALPSVDNPTFGERVVHYAFNHEQDAHNPVYSEIGTSSPDTTSSFTPQYEALYSESTFVSKSQYENSISGEQTNEGRQSNSGMTGEITSEHAYDLPAANLDSAGDNNGYSTLGQTDYSTLEPHIPRTKQLQLPPANDEYSQLQHL